MAGEEGGDSAVGGEVALVGRVPVRNVWYLMWYASFLAFDVLKEVGEDGEADVAEAPDDIPNLVAGVLARQAARRLRRHLSPDYVPRVEVRSRVRGRIDVFGTERRQLLSRGRVVCRFEALTVDTARNRYVRCALGQAARLVGRFGRGGGGGGDWGGRCRGLARAFEKLGVGGVCPSYREVAVGAFGRREAGDKAMVWAARLVFELCLPVEAAGVWRLPQAVREARVVYRVFEKGVAGFLAFHFPDWNVVPGRRLQWPVVEASAGARGVLPSMVTDVALEAADGRRVVVDTKFNAIFAAGWFRGESLRSAYVYQMYAYLRSQEGEGGGADAATGLLLHPVVGGEGEVTEWVVIQNHKIVFATVDLAADAEAIRGRLLEVMRVCGVER